MVRIRDTKENQDMPLFGITIRRETELFTVIHAQDAEEALRLAREEAEWATVIAEDSEIKPIEEAPEWAQEASRAEGTWHVRE
jgi:hypothetical protein